METKEVKIECPLGYEVDKEKSTFEKIVFKKKERVLPKTWKEFYNSVVEKDIINRRADWYNIDGYLHCLSERYFKSLISLAQLLELRDYYNDGWMPDWNNSIQEKYYISIIGDDIRRDSCWSCRNILSFKDEKTRDEFYNNFKSLIEQIKELI